MIENTPTLIYIFGVILVTAPFGLLLINFLLAKEANKAKVKTKKKQENQEKIILKGKIYQPIKKIQL